MAQDPARVVIGFAAEGLGGKGFSPLNLPGTFDIDLHDVDPDLLERLQADFELDLCAGHYPIPLTDELVLPVDVPQSCRASGWVSAERRDEAGATRAVVSSAGLVFDPPLVLHNIVPVLANLSALFEDRHLADLLHRTRRLTGPTARSTRHRVSRRLRPHLDRWLPAGTRERERLHRLRTGLRDGSERLAEVLLRRVSARPVLRQGIWQLDLRFTGQFNLLGRAPVPFREVHVPHLIIPWPHAALSRLLSEQPLATATLLSDRIPVDELAEVLGRVAATLRGTMSLRSDVPEVDSDLRLAGQGQVHIGLDELGSLEVEGAFEASMDGAEARLDTEGLSVRLEDGSLRLDCAARVHSLDPDRSVAGVVAEAAVTGEWPRDLLQVEVRAKVLPGSHLDHVEVRGRYAHPLLKGSADLTTRLSDLSVQLDLDVELTPEDGRGRTRSLDLVAQTSFEIDPGSAVDEGTTRVQTRSVSGRLEGRARADGPTSIDVDLRGDVDLEVEGRTLVDALPELSVDEGELVTTVVGRAGFAALVEARRTGEDLVELVFGGSRLHTVLDQVRAELGERAFTLPQGSVVEATVTEGHLDTSGLGHALFNLHWDLQGLSPLLHGGAEPVEIFVPDLRQGNLDIDLSPVGGLTISGEEHGLYDARYFNALLNPEQETDRWMALLSDDEALDHVTAAARVFSDDLADLLEDLRTFARRVEGALEAEQIHEPADFIPGPVIARVISRILVQTDELEGRIHPLVKQVTDGKGLDVIATKRLLDDTLPEHEYGFEVDRVVRWLALVLGPTEPIPPRRVVHLDSLAERPDYAEQLAALPSATELYQVIGASEPLPAGFSERVARVAPYLTPEQISWILASGRDDWRDADLTRLRYVGALKHRVRMISESYGGLGYAPQAAAIGFFLGATVNWRPSPGEEVAALDGEPPGLLAHPDCLLGPQDTATLLQAGLAAAIQGRIVQYNQRMLLDLVLAQPPEYLRHVLWEMSEGIPRVLAGVLMALLSLEQGALSRPLELVSLFSERLGIELPRLDDFMAGGRWAKQPYYEALNTKAERILEEGEPWQALKVWLQTARRPVDQLGSPEGEVAELVERAKEAIAHADDLGGRCSFSGREPTRIRLTSEAYRAAFAACREVMAAEPRAFQWDWLKHFWGRNYEALMVRSVVRNVQDDVDAVRRWLRARLGRSIPRGEQALVDAVIDVLYLREDDQAALKADPLVRLLLEVEPGPLDFTVISCMGVVTEGEQGRELEDAFARLEEQRGVRLIRSNTATARSLEYNAAQVEAAVRRATTPWGYVGYSQGCANGLRAEARILGGTPGQQALADGLRCRHLLCSAVNGSAHGTGGDMKFLRAMVDGENFLSHYQTVFSRQAIDAALKLVRLALDSRFFIHTMGGVDSLSYDGVVHFLREVQVRGDAPTTLVRGVVSPMILPEALELLSNMLTAQIETDQHDTQVVVHEAVGHPVYVDNAQADQMRACDMGALPQQTHHWSPLLKTTEFITTERDRERCIYDFPKDRHVFPWVEVNARFGVIDRLDEG